MSIAEIIPPYAAKAVGLAAGLPKIFATADLHGDDTLTVPECNILIVAGDVCPDFAVNHIDAQLRWLDTTFRAWLLEQPATHVVGIAGNHDFVFEKCSEKVAELCLPWIYLRDEGVTINGIKFWGTPWVPNLSRWAFHADDVSLDAQLALVPSDTDVVIGHGPPYRYGDFTMPQYGSQHAGFPGTNDMLARVRPAAYVCGHIHEGYGSYYHPHTIVYNVARMTEYYFPINSAQEIVL
jgi:Icc-related predicted phosphoesterase